MLVKPQILHFLTMANEYNLAGTGGRALYLISFMGAFLKARKSYFSRFSPWWQKCTEVLLALCDPTIYSDGAVYLKEIFHLIQVVPKYLKDAA